MTTGEPTPGRRHTGNWYAGQGDEVVSPTLLGFAHDRGGERVLDLGSGPGAYSRRLAALGHRVVAVDTRFAYARRAAGAVPAVQADGWRLPFPAGAVDTVLLFEVLEHVPDPATVVAEAARVAGRNVLVTVPNCAGHDRLRREAVTFEHMLDDDHRHFFTPASLRRLLEGHARSVDVDEGDFVDVNLARLVGGRPAAYAVEALRRLRLYRPKHSSRLFAELSTGG